MFIFTFSECLSSHAGVSYEAGLTWHMLCLMVYWLLYAFSIISFIHIVLISSYTDMYKIYIVPWCVLQTWPSNNRPLARQHFANSNNPYPSVRLRPPNSILIDTDSLPIAGPDEFTPTRIQTPVLFSTSVAALAYPLIFSRPDGASVPFWSPTSNQTSS